MQPDNSIVLDGRAWWQRPLFWWMASAFIYVLFYASWLAFKWTDPAYEVWIADLVYVPPGVFAFISALYAIKSVKTVAGLRLAWALIAIGLLALVAGDLVYLYLNQMLDGGIPFPSFADVLYLLFYPFALLGVLAMPITKANRRLKWRRVVMEFLIISIGTSALMWYFIISPSILSEGDFLAQFVAGAYPVMDLVLLVAVVILIVKEPHPQTLAAVSLFGFGILIYALADVLNGWLTLNGLYESGHWVDLIWSIAYVLMGLAAIQQTRITKANWQARFQNLFLMVDDWLPVVISIIGVFVALYAAVTGDGAGPRANGLFVGVTTLIIVVMIQFYFTQKDNDQIIEELRSATRQLETSEQVLQTRVIERIRDLQIAAQVGKELLQKGDLQSSLRNAVDIIARDFDFYAAQVYLFDPALQLLMLGASSGEVGKQLVQRGHRLSLSQNSLNSKAATERRMALATDTARDPNFRVNPLRPHIRSEIALPLLDGARLLGVLDLQSDEAGRFTQADVTALQLLADEVTLAIRNAELLGEAEQAWQSLEKQTRWLTRQGWQEFLDAIHRREHIRVAYQASDATLMSAETRTLTTPIQIAGQAVGEFALEMPVDGQDEAEINELMQATAQAVAQQVENLRLLAQGEQYRAEAEEAVRRLTREGWQGYVGKAETLTEGFAYDGELVQSASGLALNGDFEQKALELRGEQFGEILVEKESLTPEAEQILASVADQLAAHIENLRLSEQTQVALIENERQNVNLSALNRVVSAASGARDMAGLLDTAAHEILKTLKARNAGIAVFTDAARTQLKVMADANSKPDDSSAVGVLIPVVGNTSTEYVLAKRHSLVVEKAQTDPRTASIHALMQARNTHSLIIVPLLARGEIVGTIGVDSDDADRHFTPEEVTLVETMAGQLAGAIDNLRSFDETQRRANREATVNAITQKIQETVSVESALQTAAAEIGRLLKLRRAVVEIGRTPAALPPNGSAN